MLRASCLLLAVDKRTFGSAKFQEVAERLARAAEYAVTFQQLMRNNWCALFHGSDQLDIREFEMKLEMILSQYESSHRSFVPVAKFDGIGTLPSCIFRLANIVLTSSF